MLEELITTAAGKAIDELITYIKFRKTEKDKQQEAADRTEIVEQKIKHQLELKRHQTLQNIKDHFDFLDDWAGKIHILGMREPKKIGEVFIELSLTDDIRKSRLVDTEVKRYTYSEVLVDSHNLVILGDPGCGKTTSVKRIATDFLHKFNVRQNGYMPLVIRLRDFKSKPILLAELKKFFGIQTNGRIEPLSIEDKESQIAKFVQSETRAICRFLDELQVFIMLDGLDEIPLDWRESVLDDLHNLAPKLKKVRFLLTCRSAEFSRNIDTFMVYEIQKLTNEQKDYLCKQWFTTSKRRRSLKEFISALDKMPYKDIGNRPLAVACLCLIFEKYGELPEKPKSIYRKMLNLFIEEWDADRNVRRSSRYSNFDPQRKMDFLSEFAFILTKHYNNTANFSSKVLLEVYEILHGKYKLPKEQAIGTVKEIESHTGIIVKSKYDNFEFSHRSIQEFLVAEYLSRLRYIPLTPNEISNCPNELAVAVALSSDPTDWFCELFLKDQTLNIPDCDWIRVFLSRIVRELPDFTVSTEIGFVCLSFFSNCHHSIELDIFNDLFSIEEIKESIQSYLRLCDIRSNDINKDYLVIRCQISFKTRYVYCVKSFSIPKQLYERYIENKEKKCSNHNS